MIQDVDVSIRASQPNNNKKLKDNNVMKLLL